MIGTKVIETKLIPDSHFIAITLFGIVFTRHINNITKRVLNHELIHCQQQLELLYIPFYILYLSEWIFYLFKYHNWIKAYRAISFEREAYENEKDYEYIKHSHLFANSRS